jgi:hypothetical protein
MKLSIFNWLSASMMMPLLVATLTTATPAGAEQIDRSQSRMEESVPSVTDLNLSIPVDREQSHSETPAVNNRSRKNPAIANLNSSTSVTDEQPAKVKSISRQKSILATNLSPSTSAPGEQSTRVKSITRRKSFVATNLDPSTSLVNRETPKSKSNSRQKLAAVSRPPLSGNYLRLVRDPSKGTNDNGNPIHTLEAYVNGERYQTFKAVSGIASSQNFDRNRSNAHAPLPDGLYSVSNQIVPGAVPEVGKTFIGIFPQFETGRSDLGIHLDPSFNKRNGSDGTSGCIGLTTPEDRDAINEFVSKYHPHNLFVSIMPPSSQE